MFRVILNFFSTKKEEKCQDVISPNVMLDLHELNVEERTPVEESIKTNTSIILFMSGKGRCVFGRTIQDIWHWSDEKLESTHNYIQWLFPIDTKSKAIPNAPVLTQDEIEILKSPCAARANILVSFNVFLSFLGLVIKDDHVVKAHNFDERSKIWLLDNNHNYLKISRVLRCLTLTGYYKEADALLNLLYKLHLEYGNPIDDENIEHWHVNTYR